MSAVVRRKIVGSPPVLVRGKGCCLIETAGKPDLDASLAAVAMAA